MKKVIVGAALALITMGAGGTAFAGEVGGDGKPTPIAEYRAGSICSFNGLDDGSESGNPVTPGVVQSFGFLVADIVKGSGARELVPMIRAEGPGAACHGYASQGG